MSCSRLLATAVAALGLAACETRDRSAPSPVTTLDQALAASARLPADERPDLYVAFPKGVVTVEFMARTGFNPDERNSSRYDVGYLAPSSLARLTPDERSRLVALDEPVVQGSAVDFETLQLEAAAPAPRPLVVPESAAPTGLIQPGSYHNYVNLYDEMKSLQSLYPSAMALYTAGEAWMDITCPDAAHPRVAGTQTCRRQLWFMRVSTTPASTSEKPRLILAANIHGDEIMGREMLLRLIELLGVGSDPDPEIAGMLAALRANAEIYLVPSLNPDGYEAIKRNDCWSATKTSHATCYTGVDLNRNFPNKETGEADAVTGRAIETAAMMDRLFKAKPETYAGTPVPFAHPFALGANFHGGSRVVNLPFDSCPNTGAPTASCRTNYPDQGAIFDEDLSIKSIGREFANLNSWILNGGSTGSFFNGLTYGYEWYYISGGMQDWATVYPGRDSVHATIELTTTKSPTFGSATEGVVAQWAYNKKALVTYLYRGLKGLHLQVVDALGQPVTGVTVDVAGRPVTVGATSFVHRLSGRSLNPALRGYNAADKPGTLGGTPIDAAGTVAVTVSKAGHTPQTLQLTPTYFDGTYTVVTLP